MGVPGARCFYLPTRSVQTFSFCRRLLLSLSFSYQIARFHGGLCFPAPNSSCPRRPAQPRGHPSIVLSQQNVFSFRCGRSRREERTVL